MKLKKIIIISTILSLFSLTFYLSYTINLSNLPNKFIHLMLTKFHHENVFDYKIDFINIYIHNLKRKENYFNKKNEKKEESLPVNKVLYNTTEPIIYIYNTHANEEYSYQKNKVYNIVPTVQTASYVLESYLKSYGIHSIVEKKNTIDILNSKGMRYSESYKISRDLLENKKQEYKSLSYYIDVHRDSVKRGITTTTIDGKDYAKVMFLLGLENKNYLENKKIITSLNDYLNKNYPGLSRGIYEKEGKGVNGVYNQDFDSNVMLIEVGGIENTIEEVSNSLKIVADCLFNYINNNKTTKK